MKIKIFQYLKSLYIYLKNEWEREKVGGRESEREIETDIFQSLIHWPTCLQKPGLHQAKAWRTKQLEFPLQVAGTQVLEPSPLPQRVHIRKKNIN